MVGRHIPTSFACFFALLGFLCFGLLAISCPSANAQACQTGGKQVGHGAILRSIVALFEAGKDESGTAHKQGRFIGFGFVLSTETPAYMLEKNRDLPKRSNLLLTNFRYLDGVDSVFVSYQTNEFEWISAEYQLFISGPGKNVFGLRQGARDLVALGGVVDGLEPTIKAEQLLQKRPDIYSDLNSLAGVTEGYDVFSPDVISPALNQLPLFYAIRSGKVAQSCLASVVTKDMDIQDGYVVQLGSTTRATGLPVFLSHSPSQAIDVSAKDSQPTLVGMTKFVCESTADSQSSGLVMIEPAYVLLDFIQNDWYYDPSRIILRPSDAPKAREKFGSWILSNFKEYEFGLDRTVGTPDEPCACLKSLASTVRENAVLSPVHVIPLGEGPIKVSMMVRSQLEPGTLVTLWINQRKRIKEEIPVAQVGDQVRFTNTLERATSLSGQSDWTEMSVEMADEPDPADIVECGLRMKGPGKLWIRDIKLTRGK